MLDKTSAELQTTITMTKDGDFFWAILGYFKLEQNGTLKHQSFFREISGLFLTVSVLEVFKLV